MLERELIDAIGSIYEAGLEHDRWGDALESTVTFVGGQRAIMGITDLTGARSSDIQTYRIDPDLMRRWDTEFDQDDPWAEYGTDLVEGSIFHGFEATSYEQLREKAVYREIMEPLGCRDVLGSIVAKNEQRLGWLNTYEAEDPAGFSADSVSRMTHLTPHLHRAARIHGRMAALLARDNATHAMINALSFGAIACDAKGHPVVVNRQAEALLKDSTSLRVRLGRLTCTGHRSAQQLSALLANAAKTSGGHSTAGGGAMLVDREMGDTPLTLLVSPLSERRELGRRFTGFPSAVTLVLIVDPLADISAPKGVLRELFGITEAEAAVALALVNGLSLEEYALTTGVQRETVRGHLKRVLNKTDTGRQSRLVSLLARVLGPTSNSLLPPPPSPPSPPPSPK